MKVAGVWRYVYRAVDQHGQVIDVFVSAKRDTERPRPVLHRRASTPTANPVEVITDRSPALARAIDELLPAAFHDTTQYANNRVESDHGRLKARLRPMRGLKRDRTGRRDHRRSRASSRTCDAATTNSAPTPATGLTVAAAFDELARTI